MISRKLIIGLTIFPCAIMIFFANWRLVTAAVIPTLPTPTNLKVFPDDRMATVSWTAANNANSNNIVGYYVRWGKHGQGFTNSKQTIYTVTQIQPLENGVMYDVEVQSVQGGYINTPNNSDQPGGDTYAVANGNLSNTVSATLTPTSARVDAMRSRLTGFFDDMNIPQGGFDERLWNHATTACVALGESGMFINSQFHGHNMIRSDCDRAGDVARARGMFDITGRTEVDPGVIEFDIDGVSQPRDTWYIDIISSEVRSDGIPIDITSHNDFFDTDDQFPGSMIRINQHYDGISFHYYDVNNQPGTFSSYFDQWSINMKTKAAGYSYMSQLDTPLIPFVPNLRRHWRIELSPQKMKLYIDGTLIGTGNVPAMFTNIKKYYVHTTLFSYNTGKQYVTVAPTTSMLHWDNFGFNGPASNLVTHNYIDGGPNGSYPLISRGTVSNPVSSNFNRSTKISIPDSIGTPQGKARLMFTVQPFGYQYYNWTSSDKVTVNGKVYPIPDPHLSMSHLKSNPLGDTYCPIALGVFVEPSDLRTGLNDISFSVQATILNVHLELDYLKGTQPAYTQPQQIFANSNYYSVISPIMRSNDMYWFVEQDMKLAQYLTPTVTLTPAPAISGDANGDGKVDGIDYMIWLAHLNQTTPNRNRDGDFDGNGSVNGADYVIWLTAYNGSATNSGSSSMGSMEMGH